MNFGFKYPEIHPVTFWLFSKTNPNPTSQKAQSFLFKLIYLGKSSLWAQYLVSQSWIGWDLDGWSTPFGDRSQSSHRVLKKLRFVRKPVKALQLIWFEAQEAYFGWKSLASKAQAPSSVFLILYDITHLCAIIRFSFVCHYSFVRYSKVLFCMTFSESLPRKAFIEFWSNLKLIEPIFVAKAWLQKPRPQI